MRLSDAITQFLLAAAASYLSSATLRSYSQSLGYLLDFLGDVELQTISINDLRSFSASLRARKQRYVGHPMSSVREGGLSLASVASYLRPVKVLFSWLTEEEILSANPATRLKLPAPRRVELKALTLDDFKRLLDATMGDTPIQIRNRSILLFLADTGCRVGGLSHLTLSNIDVDKCQAVVIEKGDKQRTVFFGEQTQAALRRWYAVRPERNSDWLFVSLGTRGGDRLTEEAVGEILVRLKKQAGVKGRGNPHAFRHCFAREYLRNGGDVATLAKLLGHADPGVTMRSYAVFVGEELRQFHERHSPLSHMNLESDEPKDDE